MFEARLAGGASIVIRMASPGDRENLVGGVGLNRRLRPLGVPLPRLLGEGLAQPFPWMALERLPGADLGDVLDELSTSQFTRLAEGVARAQAIVGRLESAGRYGFAATAEAAPYSRWSAVPEASLARSRERIRRLGFFGPEPVERATQWLGRLRTELDAIAATPFLHDTTTRNVIVAPSGALSGIVDVDDLCFGDPRYPPALTLAVLLGRDRPETYVRAWLRAAAFEDDRLYRFYVLVFMVDLMSEHGERFNGNEQPSSPADRDRLRQAYERALERLEA